MQPLSYASSPNARPRGWVVRRYWMWVAAAGIMRVVAELIYQQTEVRDDWPTVVGPDVALLSAGLAGVLFVVGGVILTRDRGLRRWSRVWLAWVASGALTSVAFITLHYKFMVGGVLYK